MRWVELVRVNFQSFKLDARMVYGFDRVVKVRDTLTRSGSKETLVHFDKGFILFWIDNFVLRPLKLETIDELSELYKKIRSEIDAEQK